MAAFIRNLTQDNENKVFPAQDPSDDARECQKENHDVGLFHFTEHVLICGSRDETAAAGHISSASICFTSTNNQNWSHEAAGFSGYAPSQSDDLIIFIISAMFSKTLWVSQAKILKDSP